jgi:DNA-binding NtrC family response regulator
MPWEDHTDTMEPVLSGAPGRAATDAGLVLLYAADYERIPSAFVVKADTLVGRETGPGTLCIPQAAVSRVHAKLEPRSDGCWIRDLGSHNGVIVDGRRVAEARLQRGTLVRIGDAVFQFVDRDASVHALYRIDGARAASAPSSSIPGAVGGAALSRVAAEIERVAPTDMSILVQGETGTGKELVARALHAQSGRTGPLRAINCAAVSPQLVESELFGHRRGSFTGADRDHVGIIRSAQRGTLLLDEVGDMPLDVQAKLLRTLETREVVPVGAVAAEPVDVRILSATHRDLHALVAEGRFRGDLLARLAGYTVAMPPLRDRRQDLYALVRHFAAGERSTLRVSFGFMLALCVYAWPYNVRQLAAAVRRAIAVASEPVLQEIDLPDEVQESLRLFGEDPRPESSGGTLSPSRPPKPTREEMTRLLTRHRGNIAAVSRDLERNRSLVHRWMLEYGIDPALYRS